MGSGNPWHFFCKHCRMSSHVVLSFWTRFCLLCLWLNDFLPVFFLFFFLFFLPFLWVLSALVSGCSACISPFSFCLCVFLFLFVLCVCSLLLWFHMPCHIVCENETLAREGNDKRRKRKKRKERGKGWWQWSMRKTMELRMSLILLAFSSCPFSPPYQAEQRKGEEKKENEMETNKSVCFPSQLFFCFSSSTLPFVSLVLPPLFRFIPSVLTVAPRSPPFERKFGLCRSMLERSNWKKEGEINDNERKERKKRGERKEKKERRKERRRERIGNSTRQ